MGAVMTRSVESIAIEKNLPRPRMNIPVGKIGCGIYIIRNLATGKRTDCYIGMSYGLGERLRIHYSQFVSGKHPNRAINEDLQIYGASAFELKILERCEYANVVRREAELTERYRPRYCIEFQKRLRKRKIAKALKTSVEKLFQDQEPAHAQR